MSTIEDWIAKAAAQPLKDAAFALWSQRTYLDRLEDIHPVTIRDPKFAGMSEEEAMPKVKAERAEFEQQAVRRRLTMAHPAATDGEREQAILEAIKFTSDCFKHWNWDGDFLKAIEEAVGRAARKNPGYQPETLQAAENHVAYYMK